MAALQIHGMTLPIQWTGSVNKVTQQVGSYQVQTTIGINPYTETATIQWCLATDEMKTFLDQLKADGWLGQYTYTCPIRGVVTLRPNTNYSITEDIENTQWFLTVDFMRIS